MTATGIINSGNSYGAYVYGTDTWNTLVKQTVESYLKTGTVPAYHYQGVNYVKDGSNNYVKNADGTYQYTTVAQNFSNGQPQYTFFEADTQNVRWLGDGSSTSVSTSAGTGYASVVITKGSMTLEQWLNYQLTYNAANFANRYISQDSGVKIVTETVGNKTYTYVRNADNSNVTPAQFKAYLSTALESFKGSTSDTVTTLNGFLHGHHYHHPGKLPDHAQRPADPLGRWPGFRRTEQKRFQQQQQRQALSLFLLRHARRSHLSGRYVLGHRPGRGSQ